MTYYIFRHGETYQTKNNLLYGDDVETAEILVECIPAIQKLSSYLKRVESGANFSSPYLRCRQTVEIVSKITNKKFKYDDRLQEFIFGKESILQLVERLKNFLFEVNSKQYNNVIICTHGYPISGLVQLIRLGRVREPELNNYPKPGVLTIISPEKLETIDFNEA